MALSSEQLREIVGELVTRPGHEKVRTLVYKLLVDGLGASSSEVDFERKLPEVHGRADALLGWTVFEFKRDLRSETGDAEEELSRYLQEREAATGQRFVGIATDGADFLPYELRRGKLIRLTRFKPSKDRSHDLLDWLSSVVTLLPELRPDPITIRKQLGRESLAYDVARSRLATLWDEVKDHPDIVVKRKLWADRLQMVYGSSVEDDALFFQHTYLTIVAKTMATITLGSEIPAPSDLLAGKPFQDAGIAGVVESDFFDWVLAAHGSDDLIRRIAAQVARFRLGDIKHDVLKGLYESLIDPEQRHYLGEYYTPDWLADWMCKRAIDKPLEQRVLDPACGSGTFLFHAVRRFLEAADAAGRSSREALTQCTERVFGIDVHPVAVINARVTYLLALGEKRLRDRPALSIPVYLGDSLQWNTQAILTGQEIKIDVPKSADTDSGEISLTFPYRIAQDPAIFDAVVNEMLRLSEEGAELDALQSWLEREGIGDRSLRTTLVNTYRNLRTLRSEGRNHIWGYVARNLSRPVWLSSSEQRANVVIGNPPWLPYHDMSRQMQQRFKRECLERGIWAGGKMATHQDLSAYFFARCVELYLRAHGTIAFVMPYAAMTRQQYRGFQSGSFGEKDRRPLATVRFTEAWTFDETVQPLFNVPSCVLFATEGDAGDLPAIVTAYSGQLSKRDASSAEAGQSLKSRQISWPEAGATTASAYRGRFRQGATVVPRFLFVVRKVEGGRLGSNPAAPLVESRRTTLEKPPWKNLAPLRGPIEADFLRDLYLGESVAPFRLLSSVLAVIPWDEKKAQLVDADAAQRSGYRHLARWLKQAEELWEKNRRSSMSLTERLDYYGNLTAQMPPASVRVLYTASGTLPAAAILSDAHAVVEHKLYWASVESEDEGRYLIATLNSEALRARVAPYQSKGQWGARDFDKLLVQAPIPKFDSNSALHRDLARAGEHAEQVAAKVPLSSEIHFIRARQRIRKALAEDGVTARIDGLVTQLLG